MSHRLERVRDLLVEVGSEVLRKVKDPALGNELISITDVKLTPDLSQARFFVSVLAEPERQVEILKGLERASGFFRHELRHEVHMKRIPEVTFELDHTLERALKLTRLLESSRPEGEAGSEPAAEQ